MLTSAPNKATENTTHDCGELLISTHSDREDRDTAPETFGCPEEQIPEPCLSPLAVPSSEWPRLFTPLASEETPPNSSLNHQIPPFTSLALPRCNASVLHSEVQRLLRGPQHLVMLPSKWNPLGMRPFVLFSQYPQPLT